jgi:DNA transformation protein
MQGGRIERTGFAVDESLTSACNRKSHSLCLWYPADAGQLNAGATMDEFVNYLHEVFRAFGPIDVRRMFGGHGVFHEGLMFGLVADGVLYLKADAEIADKFCRRGLEQFEYVKKGKAMKMSYFMAPDDIYDDPSVAKDWAALSYEAARRSKFGKPKKKRS